MNSILSSVEYYRNWSIDVLIKMISIPTINPPGVLYEEFVNYASRVLEEMGMSVKVHEIPREFVSRYYPDYAEYPRYIVIGRVGSNRPIIHFNGHYDVVPAGSGWCRDPFKPVIEGERLYGRGAVDMKGGIAASILAIRAFLETCKKFSGTIEIALVPDEEIGGITGTGYLIEKRLSKPDYVIISEPSGINNIWIGHKGAIWGYIEIYGKQCHGSTPWEGVNAFEYMARIAEKFMTEYKSIINRKKSYYDYGDPKGAKPTITIGGEVKGGAKINIVPGYYSFSIDRRVIPEESLEDVEKEIKEFIDKVGREFPEVKVRIRITNKIPPALNDPRSKLAQITIETVEQIIGKRPRLILCLGGLDMHYYTQKGIETITYGPGPLKNAHIANEYISLNEYVKIAKVYAILLSKFLT